jgi:hypothetical protein
VAFKVRGVLALTALLLASVALALQPAPALAAPAWLDRLNAWRAATNLPPLSENTTWDAGDSAHSLYMVKNDQVTHYELSTLPYYTVAGDTAARNGNIEVSSTTSTSDESAIDWWMGAPFHAMGMMDPRLTSTGFGSYREVKSGWQAGFTLDTLRGNSFTGGTYPVFFPANGAAVPLTTYSGNEFPDPLQACSGYSTPTGLPVFVEVGGNVATTVTAHSFTGNGAPLDHCVIDSNSPSVGSNLTSRGGVIVIPRQPLQQGVQYTVALTVNGAPYTWTFGVSGAGAILPPIPAGWTSLGGVAESGTGVSSWGSTRVDAFIRGTDNGLWQNTSNGTTWGGWAVLGGVITATPSAVSWGSGRIDVLVRGQDNALYHRAFNGTTWLGWEGLGGGLRYGPTVASWGSSRLDVFVVGLDSHLWHRYFDGQNWSGWEPLGGILTSDPSAVSWANNRIDIFARGSDGQMWHMVWAGSSGWTGWQPMGGLFTTGAAVASCSAGHLDVYSVGLDHGLWHNGFNGTMWTGWQSMGGAFWSAEPGAVCSPGTTTVQLIERSGALSVLASTATGS